MSNSRETKLIRGLEYTRSTASPREEGLEHRCSRTATCEFLHVIFSFPNAILPDLLVCVCVCSFGQRLSDLLCVNMPQLCIYDNDS